MDDDLKAVMKNFSPAVLVQLLEIALWIGSSCQKHNLDLAYFDDELIVFRRQTPLSETIKDLNEKGEK